MQSLLFVFSLVVIGVIGYLLQNKSYRFGFAGVVMLVMSIAILSVFILATPIIRIEENSNVQACRAFTQTVDNARASELSDIERASLTIKISEWNEYIAKIQYQNGTALDWWIPDEVMELEMIK